MNFEAVNALRDLDQQMLGYLRGEIFSHGDVTTTLIAVAILQTLEPDDGTARKLVEKIRLF